jgi:gamma-glutamyltranspeptidase/glutathione hydrolase
MPKQASRFLRWFQASGSKPLELTGHSVVKNFDTGLKPLRRSVALRLPEKSAACPIMQQPWQPLPRQKPRFSIAETSQKGFDFGTKDTVQTYHRQIEAVKLAFADGLNYIADIRRMKIKVSDLLSGSYAADRRNLIGAEAIKPLPGKPHRGGTVYLAAADSQGNMVSFIQSNYEGFGSGMVVPGTGIALHNRGFCFSFDPEHDNCLEPGQKPYHTIIPGFLTKDGEAIGPFGVMGGFIQPQGHVMLVSNTIDFKMNPQAALDAPRFRWTGGRTVDVEGQFPRHIAEALVRMGHDVRYGAVGDLGFGRGQIIWRKKDGVLAGGSDPRSDGQVAAW